EAFSGGKSLRLAVTNRIFERQRSVNPLPACCLKGIQDIGKDERVERIEVHEQRVADVAAEHIESELAIERGAVERMCYEVIASRRDGRFRILAEPVHVALAYVAVGRIDGDMADAIAALLEQGAETVALLDGVAFFQKGITEKRCAVVIRSDN